MMDNGKTRDLDENQQPLMTHSLHKNLWNVWHQKQQNTIFKQCFKHKATQSPTTKDLN
jgi:hypothetical protein